MKKPLQVQHFGVKLSVSDGAAVTAAREACARSFFHCFAKFFEPIAAARSCASRTCSAWAPAGRLGLAERGRGGPGAAPERTELRRSGLPSAARRRGRISAFELAELERPRRRARVDVQRPVAGEPRRPGIRGDLLADRVGPAGDRVGHRAGRPEAAELASDRVPIRSIRRPRWFRRRPARRHRLGGLARQRVGARAGDERLPAGASRSARIRRRSGSSSESTSSRRSSGRVPRRSSSSSASPSRSASTASRCSPCEPNARRSRSPARIADVVEVRSEPRRAPLEVAVGARLELVDASAPSLVGELAAVEAELAGPLPEARLRARSTVSVPPLDELAGQAADLLVPGSERVARGERPAPPAAAPRCAGRPPRRTRPRARPAQARAGRARGRSRPAGRPGRP